jgi:hypothetical protein
MVVWQAYHLEIRDYAPQMVSIHGSLTERGLLFAKGSLFTFDRKRMTAHPNELAQIPVSRVPQSQDT